LVERLQLGVGRGQAGAVRPDPSTLGAVGTRLPPRELAAARPRLRRSSAVRPGSSRRC